MTNLDRSPVNGPFADLVAMRRWADGVRERAPDFVIGDDYLRRWWIIPRNTYCNVYLHEILHSDDDRALHDHPWPNTSFLISGSYFEHTPDGIFERKAGDVVSREATDSHRLEVVPGQSALSLFMTGAKVRDWGFHCPQGFVPWQIFTDPSDSSKTGRGCGE